MPRFACSINTMFNEAPLVERFAAARAAGFEAVEVQFPYATPLDDLIRAKQRAGVEVALINIPSGDASRGDRGLGALPDRVEEFRAGVALCRRYAEGLGAPRVNLLAGIPGQGVTPAQARATLIDNMRFAATELAKAGIATGIEPVNTQDVPGFFLTGSAQAIALLDEAAHPALSLQYDFYHMQIMEGDLIATVTRLKDRIGHIQFSDVPGRREPGTGEINFANVFATLDRIGYAGYAAAEYRPSGATLDSLGWFRAACGRL